MSGPRSGPGAALPRWTGPAWAPRPRPGPRSELARPARATKRAGPRAANEPPGPGRRQPATAARTSRMGRW